MFSKLGLWIMYKTQQEIKQKQQGMEIKIRPQFSAKCVKNKSYSKSKICFLDRNIEFNSKV